MKKSEDRMLEVSPQLKMKQRIESKHDDYLKWLKNPDFKNNS